MTAKHAPRRPPKALVETALAWLRLQGRRGQVVQCDMCHRYYVEASEEVEYADRYEQVTCEPCMVDHPEYPLVWAYVDDFKEAKRDQNRCD